MTDTEIQLKAKSLDQVIATMDRCEICSNAGQVPIYHRLYKGLPWVDLIGRSGKPFKFHVQAVAFCSCNVGEWYRLHNPEHDPRPRLEVVLTMRDWSLCNPTTPDLPDEVAEGNWTQFAAWLKKTNRGRTPVQHVPRGSSPRPKGDPILKAAKTEEEIPF